MKLNRQVPHYKGPTDQYIDLLIESNLCHECVSSFSSCVFVFHYYNAVVEDGIGLIWDMLKKWQHNSQHEMISFQIF